MKEGIPTEILTDQGKNFQSSIMKELCQQLGINQLRTTAYHPQTDGAVEKFNKTLGDMLTAHVANNPPQWDIQLDYCIACYNQTTHVSTKETPFYLLKGRDPLEPTDLRPPLRYRSLENESNAFSQHWHDAIDLAKAHLVVAQNKQKQNYDKTSKNCVFDKNQLVLLREMKPQTGKFYMRWDGLYTIVEKLSELNYLIRKTDSNSPFVVHVNRLKPWKGDVDETTQLDNQKQPITANNERSDKEKEETIPEGTKSSPHRNNEHEYQLEAGSNLTQHEVTDLKTNGSAEIPIQQEKRRRGRPRKTEQLKPKIQTTNQSTTKDQKTNHYNLREKIKKPPRF